MAVQNHGANRSSGRPQWWLYSGTGRVLDTEERDARWPDPPRWREFRGGPDQPGPPRDDADIGRRLGDIIESDDVDLHECNMINAALYLRRPLLITGSPGSGKSSIAYRIAHELQLGRVLRWPITTGTTLRNGLYDYDAIGRVHAASQQQANQPSSIRRRATGPVDDGQTVGDFVHLGPLGTALLPHALPRVLLIDELDKSDIDLPNNLLNVFEEGEFVIPELIRIRKRTPVVEVHTADYGQTATITDGRVVCHEFPIVVMTSNGERDFPPAFLRRCLQLDLPDPDERKLARMVAAHFPGDSGAAELIQAYLRRREQVGGLAADQLLNAVQLATSGAIGPDAFAVGGPELEPLLEAIWHRLTPAGPR